MPENGRWHAGASPKTYPCKPYLLIPHGEKGESGRPDAQNERRGTRAFQKTRPREPRQGRSHAAPDIPLHCGAVVASCSPARASGDRRAVLIPFIAGQWSLRRLEHQLEALARVSIPFIAGQWSLLEAQAAAQATQLGLNPLHCGAVVASSAPYNLPPQPQVVSIPFIAGQWSLRSAGVCQVLVWILFQSPSLRGSGRFC